MKRGLTTTQKAGIALAALLYIAAGVAHFLYPEPFRGIVPPYLPWPTQLVMISGVCEILGGLGLLFPPTRRLAAWGLVALLIAVFPANIYMATNPVEAGASSIAPILRWGRLPLQFVLGWWVLRCTQPQTSIKSV